VSSGAAAGLVSVSTSDTGVLAGIVVCKDEARFTRLQKNIGIAAKLHMLDLPRKANVCMVTCTYRDGNDWRPYHVTVYLKAVREWFKRKTGKLLQYVWVAETQERGAIHYHAIFWLPRGLTMPKADKRGWWSHGMTNTLRATKPVGYLMSYAKKLASKKGIPHGARIYGVGGLPLASRCIRRWINWPSFVQARAAVTDVFAPAPGGGWCDRATGEWWPSEYGLAYSTPRSTALVRLHDHGRPLANVAGPYSWRSA
jgi:hypothetical protein